MWVRSSFPAVYGPFGLAETTRGLAQFPVCGLSWEPLQETHTGTKQFLWGLRNAFDLRRISPPGEPPLQGSKFTDFVSLGDEFQQNPPVKAGPAPGGL